MLPSLFSGVVRDRVCLERVLVLLVLQLVVADVQGSVERELIESIPGLPAGGSSFLGFASTLDGKAALFAAGDTGGSASGSGQTTWAVELSLGPTGVVVNQKDVTTARWMPAMAAAGASKVALFGGIQGAGETAVFVNQFQVFDTVQHAWSSEKNLDGVGAQGPYGAGGATAGNVAIFGGGRTGGTFGLPLNTPTKRVFMYNESSDIVSRLSHDLTYDQFLPASCSAFVGGTSTADRVAIFAGGIPSPSPVAIFTSGGVLAHNFVMGASHGRWPACAGSQNFAVVAGGVAGTSVSSAVTLLRYDPSVSTWSISASYVLSEARYGHVAFPFGGSIYIAGGCRLTSTTAPNPFLCTTATSSVERFDVASGLNTTSLQLYSLSFAGAWGVAGDYAFVGIGKDASEAGVRSITAFKLTRPATTATTATTAAVSMTATRGTTAVSAEATTSTLIVSTSTTSTGMADTASTAIVSSGLAGTSQSMSQSGSTGAAETTSMSIVSSAIISATQTTDITSPTTSSNVQTSGVRAIPSPTGSSNASFLFALVFAVVASFCCCLFLGAAVVLVRRRKPKPGSDYVESELDLRRQSNDSVDTDTEQDDQPDGVPYDSIAAITGDGVFKPVSEVLSDKSSYARLPGRDTVEGAYHKVPSFHQTAAHGVVPNEVTILDAANIMVDTSRPIGKGEFGTVFKARYNGVDVAVKTLRNGFTEAQLQSFYDEVNTVAQLPAHPNLIGFVGMSPDPIMIVLEFAAHGSLRHFLRQNKDLSLAQQLSLMRDIAYGCRFLAENRIVHRDLAARNILLDANMAVKLCDFGMSRTILDESSSHVSKASVGPVKWYSIEAIKKGLFSEKSDVWAFAVTCHEVVNSGREPYHGMTGVQAARKVLDGYRLEFPESFPQVLHELFADCMDAEASNRPTFAQIFELLELQVGCDDVPYQSLKSLRGTAAQNI